MATTGAYLGFIPTLDHPDMVGVNPEVAHEQMAGLNFLHAVAQAWEAGKLFHIDLNDQVPGRYDQDFRFGSANIKSAFWLVKFLEDVGYAGPRHFDAHAYRTEDYDGVRDFARGCMRTYLILRERAKQWRADAEIQALVAEVGHDHDVPALSQYSSQHRHMLLATPFDRVSIARKGLGFERLDQLTMELLLRAYEGRRRHEIRALYCDCRSVTLGAATFRAAAPIRVMLLDGESGGPYHKWPLVTAVLKKQLDETGLFDVEVVTAPPAGSSFAAFKPDLTRYQGGGAQLRRARRPVARRSEGGLRAVHAQRRRARDRACGRQCLPRVAGIQRHDRGRAAGAIAPRRAGTALGFSRTARMKVRSTPGQAGKSRAAAAVQSYGSRSESSDHQGPAGVWMHQGDELYAKMRGPGRNMTVLATAHSDPANNGTGRDEPQLMVLSYGRGRVFHTTMGHTSAR
jgi:hypothetical protein